MRLLIAILSACAVGCTANPLPSVQAPSVAPTVSIAATAPAPSDRPTSDAAALCDGLDPGQPGYPTVCDYIATGHCSALAFNDGLQADENPLDDHGAECIAHAKDGDACPFMWDALDTQHGRYCVQSFTWCQVDNPDCM